MVFDSFLAWSQQYIIEVGYFAIFLASVILNSTIFVGIPGGTYVLILFAVGIGLHPLFVGLLAGLGSATGELTGYLIGFGSTVAIEKYEKKTPRIIRKLMRVFKKIGFWLIVTTALLPIPFDVIGILSGVSQYNLKKFYIAVILGRIIVSLLIAYGGYSILPFVGNFIGRYV